MRHCVFLLPVAAAFLFSGCSQPSFPVRTYPLGEKVVLGHLIYTAFDTQWLTQAGTAPDLRIPQNRFFLVRVNATNSGNADVIVPTFTVVDDKGASFQELDRGEGIPEWIGMLRSLRPAGSVSGNVLFDCPPGHYKLRVTDEDGERAALIDIPLSFINETPEVPVPGSGDKKGAGEGQPLSPGRK